MALNSKNSRSGKSVLPQDATLPKVNFQPKETSNNMILFMAYVTTGKYKIIQSTEMTGGIEYDDGFGNPTGDYKPVYSKVSKKKWQRVVVSTSLSVPKAFYNAESDKCLRPYSHIDKQKEEFITYVNQLYTAMVASGIVITKDLLQDKIKQYIVSQLKRIRKQKKSKNILGTERLTVKIPGYFGNKYNGIPTILQDYVQHKITTFSNQSYYISKKGKGTIASYNRFLSLVKRYDKHIKVENPEAAGLDLISLTKNDCIAFLQFFIDHGKNPESLRKGESPDYSYNYLGEMKKEMKNFIYQAKNDDMPVKIKIEGDPFWEVEKEKDNDPYLHFTEMETIRKLKFDEDQIAKNYDKVRDAFIIGCNCAMSHADLKNLKHLFYHPKDGWYFEYVRIKRNKGKELAIKIKIPVYEKYVVELYKKKYKEEFDFNISSSTFNEHLEQICLLARLYRPVVNSKKDPKTGETKALPSKLWEKVSSKTMRKTFASNMVREYNKPLSLIKQWTGHSSEEQLLNYIQLSQDEYYQMANVFKKKAIK